MIITWMLSYVVSKYINKHILEYFEFRFALQGILILNY
jgi:hypothetical protein